MATNEPRLPLGAKPANAPTPVPSTDLRELDPRAAAAARAAQLTEHWGGERPEATDEYWIDPNTIPDGWSYEWKRLTVLNAPDPSYAVQIRQGGWEPVPTYRHPEMMPEGHDGGAQITRKGMGLFERPAVITEQAKAGEYRKARMQVKQKEEQLNAAPSGQFDRQKSDGSPLVNIKKSYEAIPIPK